ncbi:LPS export ABC transporter periplasmic protein LptC [Brevundimonas aveniformis]|uniref:LPS export ABC transporter periplasmic protein LptC n=1 Tax=Brevundimonas aveniformis TaxID=370977 RepID=UPI002493BA04|nr:LPS export ABC transporter periplasmic protein LptC [Brevundimonas aveniformis]
MTQPAGPVPSLLEQAPTDLATVRREDARRVVEAMEAWRKRSRMIHFFRRALPIALAVITLGTVGWVIARTVLADMADQAAQQSDIRMTNPRFYGQDAQGQSFVLAAAEAVQDRGEATLIHLTRPALRLNATGERPTEITALAGIYNEREDLIELSGEVTVIDGGTGFRFDTGAAVIDTSTGVISGRSNIRGRGRLGTIDAASYAIYDQGARLVFEGDGDRKVTGVINMAD